MWNSVQIVITHVFWVCCTQYACCIESKGVCLNPQPLLLNLAKLQCRNTLLQVQVMH